jgi:hypothetical protein
VETRIHSAATSSLTKLEHPITSPHLTYLSIRTGSETHITFVRGSAAADTLAPTSCHHRCAPDSSSLPGGSIVDAAQLHFTSGGVAAAAAASAAAASVGGIRSFSSSSSSRILHSPSSIVSPAITASHSFLSDPPSLHPSTRNRSKNYCRFPDDLLNHNISRLPVLHLQIDSQTHIANSQLSVHPSTSSTSTTTTITPNHH